MGKEFGYAMLLILTIIFLCRPLQPGWNSLDILKIFPRYFLFLPLPLACSYSASPKYVCHMWGVLRPRLKMCTWVCMCTWMCSQCILLERGTWGGENTYVCVWQRFPSQSQSHGLLFLADLSTDPAWVPQMSVRDRSTHLSLTPPLQYNHPAYGR